MPRSEYAPLAEGPEASRSGKKKAAGQKQKKEQGAQARVSFESVLQLKEAETLLNCVRQEAVTSREIEILSLLIDQTQHMVCEIRAAKTSLDRAICISFIADEFDAVDSLGLSFPLKECFLAEVDSMGPFPSADMVKEFMFHMDQRNRDEQNRMGDTKISNYTDSTLFQETAPGSQWGAYPICEWFNAAHCVQFLQGHQKMGAWMMGDGRSLNRTFMPWLSIPLFARILVNGDIAAPNLFEAMHVAFDGAMETFAAKGLVLLLFKLTQLRGAMIGQVEKSKACKAKVQGAVFTLAITAGQTFAQYVNTHYLSDHE